MNWSGLWEALFHTQEICHVNMGFWVSMGIVCLVVVVQNLVFWLMKPSKKYKLTEAKKPKEEK